MSVISENTKPYNLVVILGPTASGKTSLAVDLAFDIGGEIISADSRQVYRGMDLGTGKDYREFTRKDRTIPYHLIDIVDADYEFNLFEYQQHFYRVFKEVRERRAIPILVGGTGLYLESIIEGYDMAWVPPDPHLHEELEGYDMDVLRQRLYALNPSPHNTTDLVDKRRLIRAIEIEERRVSALPDSTVDKSAVIPLVTGIRVERPLLQRRIELRLRNRLDMGMVEEVKRLHLNGLSWKKLDYFGLEYRYVGRYLQGELTYDEMVTVLAIRIRQFAKRQETWFRRMERKGICIHWIDYDDYESLKSMVEECMVGA